MPGIFFVWVLPMSWHRAKDQFAPILNVLKSYVGELPVIFPTHSFFTLITAVTRPAGGLQRQFQLNGRCGA